jgi:hypothetical protein
MPIQGRKLIVLVAVAALALANSVSARHALATVSQQSAQAANAHHHEQGDGHSHQSHSHDVAPDHAGPSHDGMAGSAGAPEQTCCAAWCAGAALIFASPSLVHAASAKVCPATSANALVLSALNSLDPPPR